MLQITSKHPVFAQIESNDKIVTFKANCERPMETIVEKQIEWYNNELYAKDSDDPFKEYISRELMLESSYINFDGKGFATTIEAAKDAIIKKLNELIKEQEQSIDNLNKEISIHKNILNRFENAKSTII